MSDIDLSGLKITNANNTVFINFKGVLLEIARSNSTEYISKLRRLIKKNQSDIDNGLLTVEEDIAMSCRALAGTVLVGWKEFEYNGQTITFSVNNAVNLMVNDPDCRQAVMAAAKDSDRFEKDMEGSTEGK